MARASWASASRWRWAFVAASLGAILAATLVPGWGADSGRIRWCLLCGDFGLADAISNVILFAPAGAALRSLGLRGRRIVVGLALLSAAIELAQLGIPGRETALGDLVANTAGACAGVAVAGWWPRRRRSASRASWAVGLALAVTAGIAWVQRPHFPRTTYWGEWAPLWTESDWRGARVRTAAIGEFPLPNRRLPYSPAVRGLLAAGAPLRVEAVAGGHVRDLGPLFAVADERSRIIVLLGADRDDLVWQVSTYAADARLYQPDFRWSGVLAGVSAGDSLSISVWRARDGYCLSVNQREQCGFAHAADDGWGLLQTLPHLGRGARAVLGMLFLACLGLPAGLLVPRGYQVLWAGVLLLSGSIVLPPLLGLAPTAPLSLAGSALGLVAGWLVPEPRGKLGA